MPMANPTKFMRRCDVRGQERQYGPYVYEGRHIQRYRIFVCCYDAHIDAA